MARHIAIILAAGSGRRTGLERPKQFALLAGRPVIAYSIEAFNDHPAIDEVAVVVSKDFADETAAIVKRYKFKKVSRILLGGKERTDSSLAAIRAFTNEDDILLFHDAARPLISEAVISRVIQATKKHKAVGTAVAAVDTIIETDGERLLATPNRDSLRRMQTPQAFHRATIAEAYRLAMAAPDFRATDDCGVVARYLPETPIGLVEGEERNLKLTYADDLPLLEHFLQKEKIADLPTDNTTPEGRRRYLNAYHKAGLRRLQEAELNLLREVAAICQRHKIPYWLDSGTLLGAVRHGGFIPWDDDIDICMPKEEIARFVTAAREELPHHLFIQTPETDPDVIQPVYKVRDLNSVIVEGGDDFSKDYSKGLFIDIFPMEAWPTLPYKLSKRIARGYCRAGAILRTPRVCNLRAIAEWGYFRVKRIFLRLLWKTLSLFTSRDKYYSNIINQSGNGNRHLRSTVFPLSVVRFEGETFSAPADTDRYLRDLYGEYMKLPPEDQRESHACFFIDRLI